MKSRAIPTSLLAICIALVSSTPSPGEESPDWLRAFFASHCVHCHGEDNVEGELNLQTLRPDFADTVAAQKWVEVLDRMHLGEMPPEGEERPPERDHSKVVDWITSQLKSNRDKMGSTGGRVVMRRLTRLEYASTVRDLFGVNFVEGEGPLEKLPPDGAIGGFDRHSRALLVDPSLMDAYFQVASRIAERAVSFRPPIVPQKAVRFDFRDTDRSAMKYILDGRAAYLENDVMVLMSGHARTFSVLRHPFNRKEIPETGRYLVRIMAGADRGQRDEPVFMKITQGAGDTIGQFRVDATKENMELYELEVTRSDRLQGEFQVELVDGTRFSEYVGIRGEMSRKADEAFARGDVSESLRIKARLRAQGDRDAGVRGRLNEETLHLEPLPKLYLDYIEVVGPLREAFPPKSMRMMFPEGWNVDPEGGEGGRQALQRERAKQAIRLLLPRAFRRRATDAEIGQFVELFDQEMRYGNDYERALETVIVGILCSPKFLFLHEASDESESVRPLTPIELASRMSYFLWSSAPDDQLFRAALDGELDSSDGLSRHTQRLIDNPKIEGFVDGFVRQWLKVDAFNQFPPDERVFPSFYETRFAGVEDDFVRQPLEMVSEIIRQDASALALLDSDWTMLNERLANYYGIAGVMGDSFQRVELGGRDAALRGGLLGMAGVHRWGSDGSRTKPVERGKYILDVLFNDPPPPPPPNAGEVEPNLRGQKLTVRQRLAKHREQTSCNHCHRRIDPYGLAMENFNTIGQWRELEDGEKPIEQWGDDRPAIDPSGRLMTGAEFNDYFEFKQAVLSQQERFLRGLTEKLLAYAMARSIEPSDRVLIDAIVQRSQANGGSFRTLLASVIQSKLFRSK